jgi:hypothetical protein
MQPMTMTAALGLMLAASPAFADGPLTAETQDNLQTLYCVACHDTKQMQGGLDLSSFDSAKPDAAVAYMMASKLRGGAIGAAGIPIPDQATNDAWLAALVEEGKTMTEETRGWTFSLGSDPERHKPLVIASATQEVPAAEGGERVYQLTLTCHMDDTRGANMELAVFRKDGPQSSPVASFVALNRFPGPVSYEIDGTAAEGFLYPWQDNRFYASLKKVTYADLGVPQFPVALPAESLTVRDLFPGETVSFPFDGWSKTVRGVMGVCFSGGAAPAATQPARLMTAPH